MTAQGGNLVSDRNCSSVCSLRIGALHIRLKMIFIPQCFHEFRQVCNSVGLIPSHDWDMDDACIRMGSRKSERKECNSYKGEGNHVERKREERKWSTQDWLALGHKKNRRVDHQWRPVQGCVPNVVLAS